jgi:histidine decarboxylase
LKQRVIQSLALADYVVQQLNSIGCKAWKNKNAITVVFSAPAKSLCQKWQLATEGALTHMICMPGISKEKIDEFLNDMLEESKLKTAMAEA